MGSRQSIVVQDHNVDCEQRPFHHTTLQDLHFCHGLAQLVFAVVVTHHHQTVIPGTTVKGPRGYYPDSPDKENQDSYIIKQKFKVTPTSISSGYLMAMGNSVLSVRILLRTVKEGNRIIAEDLSYDQTPFRKDEYDRVKLCGARVLSVDQVEGLKDPDIQTWGDEETEGSDPPRLWVQNGMYPGTAFTRSVGDGTAEKIGVIAVPEVSMIELASNHLFFVVASDGVFEFLSSQTVVEMV
ncbi:putative protein phosphatase 2C 35 [Vitis vinifera]|uniref:PPM-type phosphatase domain-containing protein n=1 Tax=Vitis vinifera TaxID=29760 RepID=A0A438KKK7_VITVI|nr:putative protein phosphatase 2C 35 [Vitis vinifera]